MTSRSYCILIPTREASMIAISAHRDATNLSALMNTASLKFGTYLSTVPCSQAPQANKTADPAAALLWMMTPSWPAGETVSSEPSTGLPSKLSGRLPTLTGEQSLHSTSMPTTSSLEDKTEPSEFGLEPTVNFWFSSMVSTTFSNINDFCAFRSKERYRQFIPRREQATFDSFVLNGQNHFYLRPKAGKETRRSQRAKRCLVRYVPKERQRVWAGHLRARSANIFLGLWRD